MSRSEAVQNLPDQQFLAYRYLSILQLFEITIYYKNHDVIICGWL